MFSQKPSDRKVVSVVGARPQFIKAAMLSRVLADEPGIKHLHLHTGQHYSTRMAELFFTELDYRPDFNLAVGSGTHAYQTGKAIMGIEEILIEQKPDLIIVYGDTNATLAGALAAVKLHIPVAHVEAGLRSFNRRMPEEINRIVTDAVSDLLFCPTPTAMANLRKEGREKGVYHTGDILLDTLKFFLPIARKRSDILTRLNLTDQKFWLLTMHRPHNVDEVEKLKGALAALEGSAHPRIIFPCHPRTAKTIQNIPDQAVDHIDIILPVSYLDMIILEENADLILTDSGGVQREAYFLARPCLTLREQTEWPETLYAGWNKLVGTRPDVILQFISDPLKPKELPNLADFKDGLAADYMAKYMKKLLEN